MKKCPQYQVLAYSSSKYKFNLANLRQLTTARMWLISISVRLELVCLLQL